MSELLFHYQKVNPTTWAYLSSLLLLGLFFKFGRFWSVRNFDLILLIMLAPGLLLTIYGQESEGPKAAAVAAARERLNQAELQIREQSSEGTPRANGGGTTTAPASTEPPRGTPPPIPGSQPEPNEAVASDQEATVDEQPARPASSADLAVRDAARAEVEAAEKEWLRNRYVEWLGFAWLLVVGGVLLIRLLLDPTMMRRPLLEPNLSTGGLIFLGCSLFLFLMANVVTSVPTDDDIRGAKGAAHLLRRESIPDVENDLTRHGPGYAVMNLLPSVPTMSLLNRPTSAKSVHDLYAIVAKVMAILSHLAIIVGLVTVGYRHFHNLKMGIGAATLYLMLPYTALMTGRVDHVLPAALLIWAIVLYPRPMLAGMFIGLATGVVYYPLFLMPLWISFYWQRGVWRFVSGAAATLTLMTLSLVFVSVDLANFLDNVQLMFGLWLPVRSGLQGIWGLGWDPVYRLPVLASFVALSGTLAIWPAQKNLGTLLSCSAALMIATQFWHGFGGGLYVAWYLPLALLTIFRPNLEDRVALSVLGESWFATRRVARVAVDSPNRDVPL